MLSYKQYIHEKRSHPELNPHIPIQQRLLKYADDPDVYVSFTTIQKLGVNPHPLSQETVPGIYGWHLNSRKKDLKNHKGKHMTFFNGWEDAPYIWVLKPACKTFIKSIEFDYTKKMLKRDMEYLMKRYPPKTEYQKNDAQDVFDTLETTKNIHPWYLLMDYLKSWFMIFKQNAVLRELGYCGFGDYNSKHIFVYSPNEPNQAVFFTVRSVKVLEMFYNDRHEGSERHRYNWRDIDYKFLRQYKSRVSGDHIKWLMPDFRTEAPLRRTEIMSLKTIKRPEALRILRMIADANLNNVVQHGELYAALRGKFHVKKDEII